VSTIQGRWAKILSMAAWSSDCQRTSASKYNPTKNLYSQLVLLWIPD
jgi:hypothetical protein